MHGATSQTRFVAHLPSYFIATASARESLGQCRVTSRQGIILADYLARADQCVQLLLPQRHETNAGHECEEQTQMPIHGYFVSAHVPRADVLARSTATATGSAGNLETLR